MRRLVHLSDLHFGRVDCALVAPLRAAIEALRPDLVAVSGDLTQRASTAEFLEARRFLDSLSAPRLVVPGNHDLSFYNYFRRVVERLDRYQRHITSDLAPRHQDEGMVVLGLNTARVSAIRGGRIRSRQLDAAATYFSAAPRSAVRVLVTHHPFDLPGTFPVNELVGGATRVMPRLVRLVDVLLAGHHHIGFAGPTAVRYRAAGSSAIFVQAGTALSTRVRNEANSFNVLELEQDSVRVITHSWHASSRSYLASTTRQFRRGRTGWEPAL